MDLLPALTDIPAPLKTVTLLARICGLRTAKFAIALALSDREAVRLRKSLEALSIGCLFPVFVTPAHMFAAIWSYGGSVLVSLL